MNRRCGTRKRPHEIAASRTCVTLQVSSQVGVMIAKTHADFKRAAPETNIVSLLGTVDAIVL